MVDRSFKKMAVTKDSFLVSLLVFLCLSLSSANRVLKDNDAENESINNSVSSEQDDELHNFSNAELNSEVLKGSIPKFSSIGPTNGDCCNYGNHCGGYVCPPNYSCGGNSGCQPYYTCSPCSWQGCQVPPPHCGCKFGENNSKVQESIQTSEPDPDRIAPPVRPANHNLKSSEGAN